jgi:hypothetical protein
MSKIGCICGHTIVDQTDYLNYKADLVPDVVGEFLFEKLYAVIDSLIDAIKHGQREKWIKENFDDSYPLDLTNSSMISDLFTRYYIDQTRGIYQCENCGRILIRIGKTSHYSCFKPESDNWRNILGKNE